jgi:hypothetical protein
MITRIQLGDIIADVIHKDIKNVHLSVYPPTGEVRISAPLHMEVDTIRVFAISKLGWIKKQQTKLREQERETPREFLDRESHYCWGKRYLLKVVEKSAAPRVELKHSTMLLSVRPKADANKKQSVVDDWYRRQLKEAISSLINKWERHLGVTVERIIVRKMKTKWGSCVPESKTIRINLELAKKPTECLEYIVVHEMVHLLEPTHNGNFVALMDQFMPKWRFYRDKLNRLPVRHENWRY